MNIIIWDYESVWQDSWPQNKCRSLWPIFHGQVILCYILKRVWCMNIILGDYRSVWSDFWPHQNECLSLWPIFHDPVILCYILKTIWCMNIILGDYGSEWPDLKINVCDCYLYFMVHWFCFMSQRLFGGWVSFFQIRNLDQNKYRSAWSIFHGLVILLNIFKIIWWMNIIIIGIMDQCDTKIDLIWYMYMEVSDLYFMVQLFWEMLYLG